MFTRQLSFGRLCCFSQRGKDLSKIAYNCVGDWKVAINAEKIKQGGDLAVVIERCEEQTALIFIYLILFDSIIFYFFKLKFNELYYN